MPEFGGGGWGLIWAMPESKHSLFWEVFPYDSGVHFACAYLSIEDSVSHSSHVFPFIFRNKLEALTRKHLIHTVLCLNVFLSSRTQAAYYILWPCIFLLPTFLLVHVINENSIGSIFCWKWLCHSY